MPFLHIDMTHVVEILPLGSQELYIVSIMDADVLATQDARGISNRDIGYVEPN